MTRSEIRFGRHFGGSDVFPEGVTLSEMTPEVRVEAMAWFHACPVKDEVVREYGLDWTFRRYTECNWVFRYEVLERARLLNLNLYQKLTAQTKRIDGETADPTINEFNVPPSFETEMSPLTNPIGYAIPRMILVGVRDENGKGVKEKVTKLKQMLSEVIPVVKDPIELALVIGERLIEDGANANKIIYHLMSAGILKEEGCKTIYKEIVKRMEVEAPKMWAKYQVLNDNVELMREEGIIPLVELE